MLIKKPSLIPSRKLTAQRIINGNGNLNLLITLFILLKNNTMNQGNINVYIS